MRIQRIAIRNFRNFKALDVGLAEHAVIIGANGVGKTNFLHALRLVLDPTLPDSSRQLRLEDFWDGVSPPAADTTIEVAIDLAGFDHDDGQLALLADYLVKPEPMVARLTYRFRARAGLVAPLSSDQFEFIVFGGDREENRIDWEVRRRLPVDLYRALRDVEGDLTVWRRSPLRPLLERAWSEVPEEQQQEIANEVDNATRALVKVDALERLRAAVTAALDSHAGRELFADLALGVAPTSSDSMIRAVKLLFDGSRRTISDAGLGLTNVLYFTLKLLELELLVQAGQREHSFIAIEEPEAHLHPQLQRQVFRDFLRLRPHLPRGGVVPLENSAATILLTTHSPHIASIAPIRSLVLLQQTRETGRASRTLFKATTAHSTSSLQLSEPDVADLERYIETTRAEMLYARAVLLVEGDAEQYLVPVIADALAFPLDRHGITVCSVGGTHFVPHVQLLFSLGIPFAIATDGDPSAPVPGADRVQHLLQILIGDKEYMGLNAGAKKERAREFGLFAGDQTLEVDLMCEAGWDGPICRTLEALAPSDTAAKRARELAEAEDFDQESLLGDIKRIGKGRFAQRLAAQIAEDADRAAWSYPSYIVDALKHVAAKLEVAWPTT